MFAVDEKLAPLRGWYDRFKQQRWWEAFEERDDIVPEILKVGKRIELLG